jgi:hypothetical protein
VTSTVVVNPLNRGDGVVVLHGVGAVLVDGHRVSVSGSDPMTLAAGPHTFRSADGRKAFTTEVGAGEVTNLEIADLTLTLR